ncbi:MAG TPA: alkaline phosphatase family protein, partial [Candidatus Acidoferrales bacterium]|nr:alkaline phosphatase family protein [Candidatus Acidoferrales bacterium]
IVGLDVNASIRYGSVWPSKPVMKSCHTNESVFHPTPVDTPHFRVPSDTFLSDESGGKLPLAAVTWILPGPLSSDHPGVPLGKCGPSWVASVIDAIGASKDWNDTVIFVIWDDWGGFYDHVAPYVVRDQAGPGFRVPLLVVSPYVRRGAVVHTDVEFATLLKFTETTFDLGSLGATDASPYLNNLDAFFNFSQSPAPFTKIPVPPSILCSGKTPLPSRAAAMHSRWLRILDDDQ